MKNLGPAYQPVFEDPDVAIAVKVDMKAMVETGDFQVHVFLGNTFITAMQRVEPEDRLKIVMAIVKIVRDNMLYRFSAIVPSWLRWLFDRG